MINDLKSIINKVESLNTYGHTHWNTVKEFAEYPVFVLDDYNESFTKIVSNGQVYRVNLVVDFYIISKTVSNDYENAFDLLVYNTIKSILDIDGYTDIKVTDGNIYHSQISSNRVIVYQGKISMQKDIQSYEQ